MKKVHLAMLLLTFTLFAQEGGFSFLNPAELSEVNKTTLSVTALSSTEPRLQCGEGAFILPIGLYQTGALRIKTHRKVNGFNGFSSSVMYVLSPWNRLSFGGALGYLNYEDTTLHHRGLLDLGASYRLGKHPILGQHLLGLSAHNLFFASSGLRERLETPTNINVSWDGVFWDDHIEMSGRVGVNLEDSSLLYLASFQIGHELIAALKAEITDEYWRAALVKEFYSSIGLLLSASYGQYRDREDFLQASLSKTIGPHRERAYAKKNARFTSPKPGDLWVKMLRAYSVRDFYPALKKGGNLVVEFPDFFQNPLAHYYIGNMFQELDCREAAQRELEFSVAKFPASKAVPYCRLALLKLAVRNCSQDAESLYTQLQDSVVADSIQGVSHYYMGKYFVKYSEYAKAVACFQKVPTTVESYQDAQDNIKIAEYYLQPGAMQSQKDAPLLVQLGEGRQAYEKAGLEFLELIKVHPTSYTIGRLKELEEEMAPYRLLLEQYKLKHEKEKKRILQLSGE